MSNQLQITGGAKVRSLEGVITGTSGVLNSLPINAANGIPQLDSSGKILVSQLPNSVMEYQGTWNVTTNVPYLVNGVGNAGDVYLVTGAATGGTNHNFGAGNILFYNGDQAIYDGSAWQRASGSSGTVTSVGLASSSSAFTITNSPITTSGNIGLNFAGSSTQYIAGDGTLVTFPTIITEAQNLICDVYNNTGATLTKGTIVYINGGHGNLPTVTKALATSDATSAQTFGMVQVDITNNNNGHVVVIGQVSDLNTSAYADGTQLYLSSTTAGAYTSTKQYAPAHLVYVGIVVYSHPVHGTIEVKIQNGYELDELHNVSAQSPLNNQGIFYNSSTSLWENKSIATALGYTPANTSLVVPYTGATTNVNLGAYNITANSIIKNGGTSNQFLKADGSVDSNLYVQSVSGTAPVVSSGGNTPYISMHVADTYNDGYLSSANWNTFNNKANASGTTGQVAFYNGSNSLTSSSQFWYFNSYSRLGIGDFSSITPVAALSTISTVGAWYNRTTAAASYNGIGLSFDSGGYGHLFQTDKVGTAPSANVSFLNNNTALSLDENYNVGINTYAPVAGTTGAGGVGLDIFGGSSTAALALHNTASGTTTADGGRLYLTTSGGLTLRNFETGGVTVTADNGDFVVLSGGYEKIKAVNGGYVGIMAPASIPEALTVNGSIQQSGITSTMVKVNSSGKFIAAVSGTDYIVLGSLSATSPIFYNNTTGVISSQAASASLSGYVTTNAQTIAGAKTFSSAAIFSSTISAGGSISASGTGNIGVSATSSDNFPLFQLVDGRTGGKSWNIENARVTSGFLEFYSSTVGTVVTISQAGAGTFSSSVTANSLIKTGGTSSQFLKADGSVDSTSYFSLPSLTSGSVLFSNGSTIAQNNTRFYWDNTNMRLGIGSQAVSQYITYIAANSGENANAWVGIENKNTTGSTALRLLLNASIKGGFLYDQSTNLTQLYSQGADLLLSNSSSSGIRIFSSTANVSINNSTDSGYKLDVTGTGRFSGSVTLSSSTSTLDVSGVAIIRGNGSAYNTHYFTTGSLNVAAYNQYNASGTLINRISAGSDSYITGGNVGIGTSSPNTALDARATSSTAYSASNLSAYVGAYISNQGTGGFSNITLNTLDVTQASNCTTAISAVSETSGTRNSAMTFATREHSTGNIVERMRITSGGNIEVKTSGAYISFFNTTQNTALQSLNDTTLRIRTLLSGSGALSIESLGTGLVYSNSGLLTSTNPSDNRLKEDIKDISWGLSDILKIRPVSYHWKDDKINQGVQFGFIAQEVQEVMPEAIKEFGDDIKYLGLEKDAIYVTLVKAIQEQQAQIEELKQQVQSLLNK